MIHIHRSKYRALASTLCCLNKFRQCARCFFQCILPALLPQEIYQVLITQLCVRKTIQHIPKGMEKLHWFLWPSFYNFGLQNIFLQWILWWNIMKSHIKKKKKRFLLLYTINCAFFCLINNDSFLFFLSTPFTLYLCSKLMSSKCLSSTFLQYILWSVTDNIMIRFVSLSTLACFSGICNLSKIQAIYQAQFYCIGDLSSTTNIIFHLWSD